MRRAFTFLTIAVSLLTLTVPARAQRLSLHAYGVRAGVSLDEDLSQVLVGGHADFDGLAPNVRVQPLMTVGVGDDALSLLLGGEVHYVFPSDTERGDVSPYLGGGVALHRVDFDDAEDQTDAALLVTGGIDVPVERWWGWFVEGRFVIEDDTIFRVEGGLNWRY